MVTGLKSHMLLLVVMLLVEEVEEVGYSWLRMQ